MTTFFRDRTDLGGVTIYKTAGVSSPAITTAYRIPVITGLPTNAENFAYPPVTNAAGGQSSGSQGKRTPFVTLEAPIAPNWFTAAFLNDLIGGSAAYLDVRKDSSEFAIVFDEPIMGQDFWTGFKFMQANLVYVAAGGPLMLQMTSCGIFGDSDDGSPPTVAAYTTNTGQEYGTSDVVIVGADQVDALTISLMRAQGQQMTSNGTVNPNAVSSGMSGGSVAITQSSTATQTAFSSITIGPSTTGVKIAAVTNLDSYTRPWGLGPRRPVRAESMVDFSGGAFPNGYVFQISAAP